MGVIKDGNKKHYVWCNSSLKYKDKHFPSAEVMKEALLTIKKNVNTLNW